MGALAELARGHSIGRAVADFLLPPQCLKCGEVTAHGGGLCAGCWRKLTFITEPCCDRRGIPFAYDPGPGILSAAAIADPPKWDRARAAVRFDEHSKPLVHDLKYHDRHQVAPLISRLMATAGRALIEDAEIVVPVPLYRWRLWRRRFNQSALLAQRIAGLGGIVYRPDLLERVRATPAQVGLDHRQRKANVKGAFAVAPERRAELSGKTVLLVDDVITTGSTADACARALKKAGARCVNVLCFALVLDPQHLHI